MATKKPALIFLHGFRGAPEGLAEIMAEFNDFEVYAPAVPPFGGADGLAEYTPTAYASFVETFIRKNKLQKPVLIGHSMGSIVTAAVAERYPDKINQKIILMSPISEKPSKFFARLEPLTQIFPNRTLGWLCTRYLFVPKDRSLYKKTLQITYECGAKCFSKKDTAKAVQFSAGYAVADFEFRKDVLMLAGEKDRLIPKKKTVEVAKNIGAETKFIKNGGHLINYEHPKAVAKAIRAFLDE